MTSVDYVVSLQATEWQVLCPGRYRGFFVSASRALDIAFTLAVIDGAEGRRARVIFRGVDGSLQVKWPRPDCPGDVDVAMARSRPVPGSQPGAGAEPRTQDGGKEPLPPPEDRSSSPPRPAAGARPS